jgi:hypothetical protein
MIKVESGSTVNKTKTQRGKGKRPKNKNRICD